MQACPPGVHRPARTKTATSSASLKNAAGPPRRTSGRPVTPGTPGSKAAPLNGTAAPFVGIQPLEYQLGECRQCPLCDSTVIRPVALGRALALVLDDLLSTYPPPQSAVQSALFLAQWADQHVPAAPSKKLPLVGKRCDPWPADLVISVASAERMPFARGFGVSGRSLIECFAALAVPADFPLRSCGRCGALDIDPKTATAAATRRKHAGHPAHVVRACLRCNSPLAAQLPIASPYVGWRLRSLARSADRLRSSEGPEQPADPPPIDLHLAQPPPELSCDHAPLRRSCKSP